MRNGMRVKWKYFYLDCRVEEGQALGDVLQDDSEGEVLFLLDDR